MAEYTPTTEDVREVWVQEQDITHGEGADFHAAEFDRWLAAHETELRERIAQDIEAEAERMILTSDAWTRGEERHLDGLGLAVRIARGAAR